jgi:hypothetical protein
VAYFDTHDNNSTDPYPKDIWDKWIELFASPDPIYFPNLANNALATMLLGPNVTYRFEVRVVEMKGTLECAKNARVILGG